MYCPSCGSEERQLSQFCHACGTDLRSVRVSLERPDAITASAVSAREQVSRAIAEKIRHIESSNDWGQIAEVLLPRMDRFLESPEEKRLRRLRAGVVTASIGLAEIFVALLLSAFKNDLLIFAGLGIILLLIGLGILVNGLVFTVARKEFLDLQTQGVQSLDLPAGSAESKTDEVDEDRPLQASVIEHTTHQLKPNRS